MDQAEYNTILADFQHHDHWLAEFIPRFWTDLCYDESRGVEVGDVLMDVTTGEWIDETH
jgi:hypothetical protein